MDLFSLCFGLPKPFHRLWLRQCSLFPATFHIITDKPEEWQRLLPASSRIRISECSIKQYFLLVARALDLVSVEKLVERYGRYFYHITNGWTACGFRPLLPHLFPDSVSSPTWGWLDYDVLLPKSLAEFIATEAGSDPQRDSFFIPRGVRWEQFKLFRASSVQGHFEEFTTALRSGSYKDAPPPLEVQFVYSHNRTPSANFSTVSQTQIAVHWHYTQKMGQIAEPNRMDVAVDLSGLTLKNAVTGEDLLLFIADDECKNLTQEDVTALLSAPSNRFVWAEHPAAS